MKKPVKTSVKPKVVKSVKLPWPEPDRNRTVKMWLEDKTVLIQLELHKERPLSDISTSLPVGFKSYYPGLHSSAIKDFQKCERFFFLKDRLGLTIPGNESSALYTGRIVHNMIEQLFRGKTPAQAELIVRVGQEARLQEIETKHVNPKTGLLSNGNEWIKVRDDLQEDIDKGLAIGAILAKKYPPDLERFRIRDVERTITASVHGRRSPITGKIDLILEDRKTKYIWIQDAKTTSKYPSQITGALTFELQPSIYRLLAMAAFPDQVVAGFIHSLIRKPTIKYCPDTKDKGGFNDYINRVEQWYLDEELKGPKYAPWYHSESPFFSPVPGDVWEYIRRTDRASNGVLNLERYPRCCNQYTCTGIGSMAACEYLPLCSTPAGTWKRFLQPPTALYVQRHRDEEEQSGG